jgi:hypothetical protein
LNIATGSFDPCDVQGTLSLIDQQAPGATNDETPTNKTDFRWLAIGLAGAMLFGCGGAGESSTSPTEMSASVTLNETAMVLSVRTQFSASGKNGGSERQHPRRRSCVSRVDEPCAQCVHSVRRCSQLAHSRGTA